MKQWKRAVERRPFSLVYFYCDIISQSILQCLEYRLVCPVRLVEGWGEDEACWLLVEASKIAQMPDDLAGPPVSHFQDRELGISKYKLSHAFMSNVDKCVWKSIDFAVGISYICGSCHGHLVEAGWRVKGRGWSITVEISSTSVVEK